jgi:hypothetical protein
MHVIQHENADNIRGKKNGDRHGLPKLTYLADQGPLAHFPSAMASFSCPYELTSTMLLQELTVGSDWSTV